MNVLHVFKHFIWETYTDDLGPLQEQVKKYIKDLSD